MTNLIRLERPREPIRYPDDVAVLKKALNERGYDASDEDIAWAYSEWCEEWCCGDWISVDGKPLLCGIGEMIALLTPATPPSLA